MFAGRHGASSKIAGVTVIPALGLAADTPIHILIRGSPPDRSQVNPTAPESTTLVEAFFDEITGTVCYLLLSKSTRLCALIDTVAEYEPQSGRITYTLADRVAARVAELDAKVEWILETHIHADHLTAAPYLQRRLGGRIGIGAGVTAVQKYFGELFNADPGFCADGRQFDHLFHDQESFAVGDLQIWVLHTPGHTPACVTYVVTGARDEPAMAFVGDSLFMPDQGTARCDFPGGDARLLFNSIRKILALPDDTVLYTCHDYRPGGRPLRFACTVSDQKSRSIHVRNEIDESDYVAIRTARDATLAPPALMFPAVQVNMRAGAFPCAENNGKHYLKIPVVVDENDRSTSS